MAPHEEHDEEAGVARLLSVEEEVSMGKVGKNHAGGDNSDNDDDAASNSTTTAAATTPDKDEIHSDGTYTTELKFIFKLALPAAAVQFLSMLMGFVDLVSVGHLGEDELAACGLANLFFFALALIGLGLASAMDTICSQAFGAKNMVAYSLGTQRTVVVLTVMFFIFAPVWWNTEYLALLMRQEPKVAAMAAKYMRIVFPGAWFFFMTQIMSKFLSCQNIMKPPVVTSIIANILNIILNYFFIFGVGNFGGWGFEGAPIATLISRALQAMVLLFAIIKFKMYTKVWTGWSKSCLSLRGMLSYMVLGVPGCAMLSLETYLFVLVALLAGMIGPLELGVNESMFNLCGISYMAALGISIAGSVRVGNLIGAGLADAAKLAARVATALAASYAVIITVTVFLLRHKIGYMYSNDIDVVELIAALIPYFNAFQIFDAIGAVSGGLLRGLGRQNIGAIANIGIWVTGVPIAIILAFPKEMGIYGLWWGMLAGIVVSVVLQTTAVHLFTNWDKEVIRAKEKLAAEKSSSPDQELETINPVVEELA